MHARELEPERGKQPVRLEQSRYRCHTYGCISMQRYWSSLRYSFLRTLFLLAADLRRHPTPAHPCPSFFCFVGVACPARGFCHSPRCFFKSIYRHLSSWEYPSPLYCLIRTNLSPRQRPTAKSRHDQAALAVSAEARGATHRARTASESFSHEDEDVPDGAFRLRASALTRRTVG